MHSSSQTGSSADSCGQLGRGSVIYPVSNKGPFPRKMIEFRCWIQSEVKNANSTPPASSQTTALLHSPRPERRLALERHNPDAAGAKPPVWVQHIRNKRCFLSSQTVDDLCIHYLRKVVHWGLGFPVMEGQDVSHICPRAPHCLLCLMIGHWKGTCLGKEMGTTSTLPHEDFASVMKKIPETVCSPGPGAIFTVCLKLIQSDLSNANSRGRNSLGLLGEAYVPVFSLNEIMQTVACDREQLLINNHKYCIHRLERHRNVLSSHL